MSSPVKIRRWEFSGDLSESLPNALPQAISLETVNFHETSLELFDDYNRSIVSKGFALIKENGKFQLVSASDLSSIPLEGKGCRKQKAVFWWDFEQNEFQISLKNLLKLRAASPLATTTQQAQRYNLRNKDGKVIMRLLSESWLVSDLEIQSTLTAESLIGYDAEAKSITKRISSLDDFDSPSKTLAWKILEAVGSAQIPLSPKQAIQLNSEQSVHDAVSEITRTMIDISRATEAGIIEDTDTEFLHDYRVAVRKLRSVLKLIKGAFLNEDTKRLKDIFGDFARKTNRLRDLDVYLLNEQTYRSQIPDALKPGLNKMFSDFQKERSLQLRSIRRHLKSKTYQSSIEAQRNWLESAASSEGARAKLPIKQVCSKEIFKHFKLIPKTGVSINDSTPDEEVHELRIECKRLRYLLELFSSLYAPSGIKFVSKKLKRLQETLGNFNDYSVQQEFLFEYIESQKNLDNKTAAAVGGLIAVLNQSKKEARSLVTERFSEFNDRKTALVFKELFSKKGGN
ncbi:CHAD domain-containing protein [Puniceicoccaceae bacterium K14]|nr:CHAD domain-containing protein [Puniceicoccaceae bacterium K14]